MITEEKNFNKEQLEAINSFDGRIRLIACAGAGKTSVITERFNRLLDKGVQPSRILCVTFTNKASEEMKSRIMRKHNTVPASALNICTFHSLCLKILRNNIQLLGYPPNFTIISEDEKVTLLKQVYKDCKIDYELITYKDAKDIISYCKKTSELSLLDLLKRDRTIESRYNQLKYKFMANNFNDDEDYKKVLQNLVYYGYLYQQQVRTGIDFDDMIIMACMLLNKEPKILEFWQNKFDYIMVDEFQDTSKRQYELVQQLSAKTGNLFVVGDPDQAIYSWRGAVPQIILDFDKDAETKTIIMNQNYRSTPEILKTANTLIKNNKNRIDKDMFTENASGEVPVHRVYNSAYDEAEHVTSKIEELIRTCQYEPKDIAILYRSHFLSRPFEEACRRKVIPYKVVAGFGFYDRKEVKDILAYLKIINNISDSESLKRIINVPTRGIGLARINKIESYMERHNCSMWQAINYLLDDDYDARLEKFVSIIKRLRKQKDKLSLWDLVKYVIKETGYDDLLSKSINKDRIENINELLTSIRDLDCEKTLSEYLDDVSLLDGTRTRNVNNVSLMTVHASKGLEFPVIFVVGMSGGTFPTYRSDYSPELLEEERRLAYVAYTRAKDLLFMSDNTEPDWRGEEKYTSIFVREVMDCIDSNKDEYYSNRYEDYDDYEEYEEDITDEDIDGYYDDEDAQQIMEERAKEEYNKLSAYDKFRTHVNYEPFAKSTSHFYDGQENSAFWNSMIDVEDIVDYGDLC